MNQKTRILINQQNAQHSTGPRTDAGKERSKLNAVKHNLSGNHLVLQDHEYAEHTRMSKAMLADLKPQTEPERQIAQKIIDLNFRINRITAIENNLLNFDMSANDPQSIEDEGIARMFAQTRAWKKDAQSFEILGRYEARLSRQLLQYQKEFERLQTVRKTEEATAAQTKETAPLTAESASFGTTAPTWLMSASPGPVLPTGRHDIPSPPASDRLPAPLRP
jgi:hypothetical protein